MISPWMNGEQGQYAPPPAALAQLLEARNEGTARGFQAIGKMGGAVGAGILGAVQAALANKRAKQANGDPDSLAPDADALGGTQERTGMGRLVNPEGERTSPLQAFAMNYRGAYTGSGENFKRFEAQGKMADATFNMLASQTPSTADDEPNVNGVTPTQWKHMGTEDKISWFASVKQANDVQQQRQGLQLGIAHMAQIGAQTNEASARAQALQDKSAEDAALGTVMNNLPETGSNPDGSFSMGDYTNAMRGAKLPPRVQAAIAAKLFTPPKSAGDAAPKQITIGGKDFVYSAKTGNFSPLEGPASDLLSTKPKTEDIPAGMVAVQSGRGWKVIQDPSQWETTTAMDPETGGMVKTQRYIGTTAAKGKPTAEGLKPAASDVAYLKAHPDQAANFEKRFGAGSSAAYLQ